MARSAKKNEPIRDRILWNRRPENARDCGDIDEIVMSNVSVHVEQMNDRCWWIGIYKEGDFDGTHAPIVEDPERAEDKGHDDECRTHAAPYTR